MWVLPQGCQKHRYATWARREESTSPPHLGLPQVIATAELPGRCAWVGGGRVRTRTQVVFPHADARWQAGLPS